MPLNDICKSLLSPKKLKSNLIKLILINIYICMYVCMFIYTLIYACVYLYIYIFIHLYICLCDIYKYIYIYNIYIIYIIYICTCTSIHVWQGQFLPFHVLKPQLFTYHKNLRCGVHDIKLGVFYTEYLNVLGWSLNSNVWWGFAFQRSKIIYWLVTKILAWGLSHEN